MGKVSKEDNKPDEELLESIYYYTLWKNRLAWTRHVIPARAYLPSAGFFVEVYLSIVPAIKEKYENQQVEVKLAVLPTRTKETLWVNILDIHKTSRNLKAIQDGQILSIAETDKFLPTKKIPFFKVDRIFNYFKNCSFTIPELESMLNSTLKEEDKKSLIEGIDKRCLITSKYLPSYTGVKKEKAMPLDEIDTSKIVENLQELNKQFSGCQDCDLGIKRKNRCSHDITPGRLGESTWSNISGLQRPVMFIGEAPGLVEEETGIAFNPNAPAGGVLRKVLDKAGFKQKDCYYTNAVLCRPQPTDDSGAVNGKPDNRAIEACNSRIKNEIIIVNPSIIVLLGKVAYRSFFGEDPKTVLSSTGWKSDKMKVYFVQHPSFVVRELSFADPSRSGKIKQDYLDHFNKIYNRFKQLKN